MILETTITYLPKDSRYKLSFEDLVKQAISEAIARQKALGLKNYYVGKNGRIYARWPNGRYASVNGPVGPE
jgi:hypothetical protein